MNIAIIGASNDPTKFGNKSVRAYVKRGFRVFPVHPRERSIEGLTVFHSVLDIPEDIDRVSVYLPPAVTLKVLDEIAQKGTKELFLNPGSESTEVIEKARALGLDP
ncbi:MAG: CoA-binding protein, partial [Candidatus Krumholzibacteriia bacterium]